LPGNLGDGTMMVENLFDGVTLNVGSQWFGVKSQLK